MKRFLQKLSLLAILVTFLNCTGNKVNESDISTAIHGKDEWKPMLEYTLELHKKSTRPPQYPFSFEWEEIGPGYCYGPAFGHWDIVHQIFDALIYNTEHARNQMANDLKNQEANGLVPGSIWMPGGKSGREQTEWNNSTSGHPPVWVYAADLLFERFKDTTDLLYYYQALLRQITWFENNRKAEGEGFFYNDILLKLWESGVDEGVRFDETGLGAWACVDATSHVYMMYDYAEKWSNRLQVKSDFFQRRKEGLKTFINDSLYNKNDSMYYDIWAIKDPSVKHVVIENFWPFISGAILKERADYLIDNYLLNESHFLTPHPVPSVSVSDSKFELRMWRGPSWNSMTYWIAVGCTRYNRRDAAKIILEKALDDTARQFAKTATIWEYYHPFGGNQNEVKRKPHTEFNVPCTDYLGHNPLLAMAALYDSLK